MEDFKSLYLQIPINNSISTIEKQQLLALYNYLYYELIGHGESDTLFRAIKKYEYLHKINIENICELSASGKIRPKRIDWHKRNYVENWSVEMENELLEFVKDIRKEHKNYVNNLRLENNI